MPELPDAQGLHRIDEDLGLTDSPSWLDWADVELELELPVFIGKQAAFADFLRARGGDLPI